MSAVLFGRSNEVCTHLIPFRVEAQGQPLDLLIAFCSDSGWTDAAVLASYYQLGMAEFRRAPGVRQMMSQIARLFGGSWEESHIKRHWMTADQLWLPREHRRTRVMMHPLLFLVFCDWLRATTGEDKALQFAIQMMAAWVTSEMTAFSKSADIFLFWYSLARRSEQLAKVSGLGSRIVSIVKEIGKSSLDPAIYYRNPKPRMHGIISIDPVSLRKEVDRLRDESTSLRATLGQLAREGAEPLQVSKHRKKGGDCSPEFHCI